MVQFNYGRRIKGLLEAKGMTQSDLAKKLGVTNAFVSQLVLRHRVPGRETIFKIADALGIPVEELLPETKTARVPVLLSIRGKAFCESDPAKWRENKLKPIDNLPLPPGYSPQGAEKEGIFAVSIDNDRLSPILRTGMKVYLKPVERFTGGGLFLYRDSNNFCMFVDAISTNEETVIRDLVDNETLTQKPVGLYKVISILIE